MGNPKKDRVDYIFAARARLPQMENLASRSRTVTIRSIPATARLRFTSCGTTPTESGQSRHNYTHPPTRSTAPPPNRCTATVHRHRAHFHPTSCRLASPTNLTCRVMSHRRHAASHPSSRPIQSRVAPPDAIERPREQVRLPRCSTAGVQLLRRLVTVTT